MIALIVSRPADGVRVEYCRYRERLSDCLTHYWLCLIIAGQQYDWRTGGGDGNNLTPIIIVRIRILDYFIMPAPSYYCVCPGPGPRRDNECAEPFVGPFHLKPTQPAWPVYRQAGNCNQERQPQLIPFYNRAPRFNQNFHLQLYMMVTSCCPPLSIEVFSRATHYHHCRWTFRTTCP